ncbi:MAG: PLP-dependent aminotransferase family protein [Lachnospiraceae bacterium]|nr:PLP-dependent aminotransferase family protein [Lachnospiraceae bacterium]
MLDRSKDTLLYMQLYDYYKELILSGKMKQGAKLPSIRQCASQLQVSRTTAEMAYMLLAADGYIISRPQSGYYVTGLWQEHSRRREHKEGQKGITGEAGGGLLPGSGKGMPGGNIQEEKEEIRIDFSSTSGGQESFNLDLWRRYVKSALRQGDRLITYGNPQGEEDLRQVLSDYLTRNRNVICSAENIVIGAGFQSLLHILCPLLGDRKKIRFLDPHFKQGQAVFEDYGFCVEKNGKDITNADLVYVTPSHLNRWGDIMPVKDRFLLLQQISDSGSMLIEDDYDSEFAYMNHPAQALQGLNGGKNVIYLSTFSRMLLPSIRISFMILPDELLPAYEKRKNLYNQTVSKADQIALCQYIRDGHLQSQIRKTKKMYEGKSAHFLDLLKRFQAENHVQIRITQGKSGMIARIGLPDGCSCRKLAQRMLSYGIRIGIFFDENEDQNNIYLSCSSVPEKYWEESIRILMEEILKISKKNA